MTEIVQGAMEQSQIRLLSLDCDSERMMVQECEDIGNVFELGKDSPDSSSFDSFLKDSLSRCGSDTPSNPSEARSASCLAANCERRSNSETERTAIAQEDIAWWQNHTANRCDDLQEQVNHQGSFRLLNLGSSGKDMGRLPSIPTQIGTYEDPAFQRSSSRPVCESNRLSGPLLGPFLRPSSDSFGRNSDIFGRTCSNTVEVVLSANSSPGTSPSRQRSSANLSEERSQESFEKIASGLYFSKCCSNFSQSSCFSFVPSSDVLANTKDDGKRGCLSLDEICGGRWKTFDLDHSRTESMKDLLMRNAMEDVLTNSIFFTSKPFQASFGKPQANLMLFVNSVFCITILLWEIIGIANRRASHSGVQASTQNTLFTNHSVCSLHQETHLLPSGPSDEWWDLLQQFIFPIGMLAAANFARVGEHRFGMRMYLATYYLASLLALVAGIVIERSQTAQMQYYVLRSVGFLIFPCALSISEKLLVPAMLLSGCFDFTLTLVSVVFPKWTANGTGCHLFMAAHIMWGRYQDKRSSKKLVAGDMKFYDTIWQKILAKDKDNTVERLNAVCKRIQSQTKEEIPRQMVCNAINSLMEKKRRRGYFEKQLMRLAGFVWGLFSSCPMPKRASAADMRPQTSLDSLYGKAKVLEPMLREMVLWLASMSTGQLPLKDGSGYEPVAEKHGSSARVESSRFRWARLKRAARAVQKCWRVYDGDVSQLKDICRQSIVFDTFNELITCLVLMEHDPQIEIVRIKNRYSRSNDATGTAGYRDVNVNIRIHTSSTRRRQVDTHICEVQLLLMPYAKHKNNEGHARYIAYRNSMCM